MFRSLTRNAQLNHCSQEGGPIGLIQDGDIITIDVVKRRIDVQLTDKEMEERRRKWTPPPYKAKQGALYKVRSTSFFTHSQRQSYDLVCGRNKSNFIGVIIQLPLVETIVV